MMDCVQKVRITYTVPIHICSHKNNGISNSSGAQKSHSG